MRVLVTGGCGFIGSAAVRFLVSTGLNIDKLTYAGDLRTVAAAAGLPNYPFEKMDILDQEGIAGCFRQFAPHAVFHLAAETHVDRSIDSPSKFMETNIHGSFAMLQIALASGAISIRPRKSAFGLFMYRQMKFMAVLVTKAFSRNPRPIDRTRPIRRARQRAIIWHEHGM